MNDTELDRLLDSWQAPAPPPSLRANVRARFPRAERRVIRRPLRWLLATGVAFAALTVAMGQSGNSSAASRLAQTLMDCWDRIVFGIHVHRVSALVSQIMDSDPQVSVDGKSAPAIERWHASTLILRVPGDADYNVSFFSLPHDGWRQTGKITETYLEFDAGTHHVVITCNRRLMMSDSPIFVRRRENR
jgi:hypothetical protein